MDLSSTRMAFGAIRGSGFGLTPLQRFFRESDEAEPDAFWSGNSVSQLAA
jgi:hypothetical protein